MKLPVQLQTLSSRLTIMVLTLLTIFTLALGLTTYNIAGNRLEETSVAGLEALVSTRQTGIEALLHRFLKDLNLFVQLKFF